MALSGLRSIVRPPEVETCGEDFFMKTYEYRADYGTPGAEDVHLVFKKLFDLTPMGKIKCWSDRVLPAVAGEHYLSFDRGYLLGIFYVKEHDLELPSHLFIRSLKGYRGQLDKWKDDVRFPIGVTTYSVCAVFPDDLKLPDKARRDPHMQCVLQLRYADMKQMGVDFDAFVDFMRRR